MEKVVSDRRDMIINDLKNGTGLLALMQSNTYLEMVGILAKTKANQELLAISEANINRTK